MLPTTFRNNPFRTIVMAILAFALCFALILLASAQNRDGSKAGQEKYAAAPTSISKCRPAVIPIENEPPAKIIIEAPLAEPLASRGVVVIQYCAENLHIVPVFGAKALAATPRVGHLHVRVDDSSWVWAEAGGNPIILLGLAPGPHKVSIELVDANHQPLDRGEVSFVIPKLPSMGMSPEKALGPAAGIEVVRASPPATGKSTMSHHQPK